MLDLLQEYTANDLITIIIILSLTLKGGLTFIDWCILRMKKFVYKSDEPTRLKDDIASHSEDIKELKESLKQLNKQVQLLIDSDKDDIKAFLTREHHYFVYQKQWIDDYSLECIEKRYNHYKEEGGNSFIKGFMEEIRALPKTPPTEKK